MPSPPFHLARTWTVPMDRHALWAAISDTSAYPRWWSWLDGFDPVPLESGQQTSVVITAPLPYDLRLHLRVVEVEPRARVRVTIGGDLAGEATLHLDGDGEATATVVRLVCDAEPCAPALRVLDRIAHRALVWGHHTVADRAVAAFVSAHTDGGPPPGPRRRIATEVAVTALVAGALSGLPSTLHAWLTGRSTLESTRAAGTLVGRPGIGRGAAVHLAVSTWWSTILLRLLPRRHTVAAGAGAGLAIGLFDLGVIGRAFPAIRRLPLGAQLADHLLFGAAVGAMARLRRDRDRRPAGLQPSLAGRAG